MAQGGAGAADAVVSTRSGATATAAASGDPSPAPLPSPVARAIRTAMSVTSVPSVTFVSLVGGRSAAAAHGGHAGAVARNENRDRLGARPVLAREIAKQQDNAVGTQFGRLFALRIEDGILIGEQERALRAELRDPLIGLADRGRVRVDRDPLGANRRT